MIDNINIIHFLFWDNWIFYSEFNEDIYQRRTCPMCEAIFFQAISQCDDKVIPETHQDTTPESTFHVPPIKTFAFYSARLLYKCFGLSQQGFCSWRHKQRTQGLIQDNWCFKLQSSWLQGELFSSSPVKLSLLTRRGTCRQLPLASVFGLLILKKIAVRNFLDGKTLQQCMTKIYPKGELLLS